MQEAVSGDSAAIDPLAFVAVLVGAIDRAQKLIDTAFRSDRGFKKALDRASVNMVNNNVVYHDELDAPGLLARAIEKLLTLPATSSLGDDRVLQFFDEIVSTYRRRTSIAPQSF